MVITTEQSIFDVTLKRAKKSKNPPRPTRRSTTFHIKVNSDEYDALRHYQELYEKSHDSYKPMEDMIKSMVLEEVYSKLKPCYKRHEDDLGGEI